MMLTSCTPRDGGGRFDQKSLLGGQNKPGAKLSPRTVNTLGTPPVPQGGTLGNGRPLKTRASSMRAIWFAARRNIPSAAFSAGSATSCVRSCTLIAIVVIGRFGLLSIARRAIGGGPTLACGKSRKVGTATVFASSGPDTGSPWAATRPFCASSVTVVQIRFQCSSVQPIFSRAGSIASPPVQCLTPGETALAL